jgi:adenine-specific DNA-methyltransferase
LTTERSFGIVNDPRLTVTSKEKVSAAIICRIRISHGHTAREVSGGGLEFPYCHPVSLYIELLGAAAPSGTALVMDFFAGSGTNGAAVIALNREENTNRKFILVEVGEHFDSILKPRLQKVIYSDNWKDGKPESRDTGVSQLFKYFRLESYEDALENITFDATDSQAMLQLEDYVLMHAGNPGTRT